MSTSLQLGLAAAGAAVLGGLMLHNAWEARKNRPRKAEQAVEQPAPPVADTGFAPALEDEDALYPDSIAAMLPQEVAAKSLLGTSASDKRPLDALIDAFAPIEMDAGARVSGEAAQAAMPASRRVGDKPFAVEGRNAATQEWETPQPGQLYDAFQAGVQLANRAGALNEIGFSEFTLKTQAFADAVNGTPHFPDMIEEVARARELDQFASSNDARLSFVLRARGAAWSTGYLQQVASRRGFVASRLPGRMVLPAEHPNDPPVLTLEFDAQAAQAEELDHVAVNEALLCLDIPQIAAEQQPYQKLCAIAQDLAKEMDGTIIDGNGYRIDAVAMESIGKDVEDLYLLLAQRDFHVGSVLARRLFS